MKTLAGLSPQALAAAFQVVFQAGGFKSYQLTLIVVNAVMKALMGRGLAFAANATLARSMAILTGPIGWAITAAWTVIDVGGAAYRVTIPAVIQVAFYAAEKKPESAIEPRDYTTKTPPKLSSPPAVTLTRD